MRIIAIDDEKIARENLRITLLEIGRTDEIVCFSKGREAIDYVQENPFDLAFVDINMGNENGLDVAQELKNANPKALIVFLTGYEEFSIDAFKLHAFDYLLKPLEDEELNRVLKDAEFVLEPHQPGIRIRTFGSFDLFVGDHCVHFPNQKSKELLAFLVDTRGRVTTREAGLLFWHDGITNRSKQSQLQAIIGKLCATLEEEGASNILMRERGSLAIREAEFECDCYQLLDGNEEARQLFMGEYMKQYSWAEEKTGWLTARYL